MEYEFKKVIIVPNMVQSAVNSINLPDSVKIILFKHFLHRNPARLAVSS